jgi:hypothetical protein
MSDEIMPRRGPIGDPIQVDKMTPDERAARIDALMALPIKERPQITIFGDDDVVGINPAPATKTPDA